MGAKRGRGRGCFIDSVLTGVDTFYADVLGSVRGWAAAPPKLRPVHPEPPELDGTGAEHDDTAMPTSGVASFAEPGAEVQQTKGHPALAGASLGAAELGGLSIADGSSDAEPSTSASTDATSD
jgi:hypothetical protein